MVIFLASKHSRRFASTNLLSLMTEAGVLERLADGRNRQRSG